MDNDKLRKIIRKKIAEEFQQDLQEISTTANVAGYLTPNAFAGDKHDNQSKIASLAKKIGYTLTKRGKDDTKKGDNLTESHYHEYRNDTTKLPHQKIGQAIADVSEKIKLIEKILHMNSRLKKEYGVSNEKLWKRTNHQMTRLEGKLVRLASKLREMRG